MNVMICCEVCNAAGDVCADTGTPIEWSEFGLTVMPDCPLKVKSDYREEKENEKTD